MILEEILSYGFDSQRDQDIKSINLSLDKDNKNNLIIKDNITCCTFKDDQELAQLIKDIEETKHDCLQKVLKIAKEESLSFEEKKQKIYKINIDSKAIQSLEKTSSKINMKGIKPQNIVDLIQALEKAKISYEHPKDREIKILDYKKSLENYKIIQHLNAAENLSDEDAKKIRDSIINVVMQDEKEWGEYKVHELDDKIYQQAIVIDEPFPISMYRDTSDLEMSIGIGSNGGVEANTLMMTLLSVVGEKLKNRHEYFKKINHPTMLYLEKKDLYKIRIHQKVSSKNPDLNIQYDTISGPDEPNPQGAYRGIGIKVERDEDSNLKILEIFDKETKRFKTDGNVPQVPEGIITHIIKDGKKESVSGLLDKEIAEFFHKASNDISFIVGGETFSCDTTQDSAIFVNNGGTFKSLVQQSTPFNRVARANSAPAETSESGHGHNPSLSARVARANSAPDAKSESGHGNNH